MAWLGKQDQVLSWLEIDLRHCTGYPGHKLILLNLKHSAILTSLKEDQRVDSKLVRCRNFFSLRKILLMSISKL